MMAWSSRYIRTTRPEPYDHVTFCPLCGIELHVIRQGEFLITRSHIVLADLAVKDHLRIYHRFRYALWSALGRSLSRPWRWLIVGLGR